MAKIRSLYFGNQDLPEGYEAVQLIGNTRQAPNAYMICPPRRDSSWAAGLTLATSNWDNFNPFYWSRVFSGEEEPEKKWEKENYFKKPSEFIHDRVYSRGHRIPAELMGQDMLYIEGTKALFFDIWRTINTKSKVFSGGLGLSLRRTPGTGKCIFNGSYGEYFNEADEFMKHSVEKQRKEKGKKFNAYEDFRRLLPYGYLSYMSLLNNPRYTGKIGNHLSKSPVKEFRNLGQAIESHITQAYGFSMDEAPEANPIEFGELSGFLPVESKKEPLTYKVRGSLVILHQLIRNRLNNLDNFLITESVMLSPSICKDEHIYREFKELFEKSGDVMAKHREKRETAIYSALVGQATEADLIFPHKSSLQDFLDVRDCNQAQNEAQSIGWGLRKTLIKEGIATDLRCPSCQEYSTIKSEEKRIKKQRECRKTKYTNGQKLFEFHKKQLESFLL